MPETIKIDHESQVPVYKQIVGQVEALVRSGEYAEGCLLPSMNELSAMLDISKETVKKAYSILRNKGFIDARQGKGFYVSAAEVSAKMSVLVLFDKLSNYKQVLFNSFAGEIGDAAEITIRLHNQNVELLEYYIEENLDLVTFSYNEGKASMDDVLFAHPYRAHAHTPHIYRCRRQPDGDL